MPGRKEQRRRRRAVVIAAAMTDEELIAQLEQASPEDLSPAMVELIRSRLEKSPAVRTALVERLYTEQYLAGALGGDLVSREQVVARAARLRPARTISKRAIGVWIASLGMASVALAFAVRPFMSRNPPVLTAQANRQSGEDAHLAGKETDSLPTVPPSRSADDPSPDESRRAQPGRSRQA